MKFIECETSVLNKPVSLKHFSNHLLERRRKIIIINIIKNTYTPNSYSEENQNFKFYTEILFLAVDIYTLGRITKTSSQYQKNIIIYAGALHSSNYINFFQTNSNINILNILENSKTHWWHKQPVVYFTEEDKRNSSFF